MHIGKTIFAQLTDHLPRRRFHTLVERYGGDYKVQTFSCYDHLLAMLFAQLASCESLRDIEACLSANPSLLYRLGIRSRIRRSTLADANENRDARIFEDFAKILIVETRRLYLNEKPIQDFTAFSPVVDCASLSKPATIHHPMAKTLQSTATENGIMAPFTLSIPPRFPCASNFFPGPNSAVEKAE